MTGEINTLSGYSDALVNAVSRAGEFTILVNARRRFPASGILIAQDLILTADHVVERDEEISVMLSDGVSIPATIAGRDPGNDLALLRVEKTSGTPAERATQEARVGQIVMAIGRPSQEGVEASFGIVSAIGGPVRTGRGGLLDRYIRSDVVPFPGFSGGPLIDTEGRVIGLNTSGLAYGAPITIPAALAWADADNLAQYGYVKRGYLGIRSQNVALSADMRAALAREQEAGLLLVSVEEGSPAAKAGLQVGDILVRMDDKPINDHDELMVIMTGQGVGKTVPVQILRGGQPQNVSVTIGERK